MTTKVMVLQKTLSYYTANGERRDKYRIGISKAIIQLLHWKKGMLIEEIVKGGCVILRPIEG